MNEWKELLADESAIFLELKGNHDYFLVSEGRNRNGRNHEKLQEDKMGRLFSGLVFDCRDHCAGLL